MTHTILALGIAAVPLRSLFCTKPCCLHRVRTMRSSRPDHQCSSAGSVVNTTGPSSQGGFRIWRGSSRKPSGITALQGERWPGSTAFGHQTPQRNPSEERKKSRATQQPKKEKQEPCRLSSHARLVSPLGSHQRRLGMGAAAWQVARANAAHGNRLAPPALSRRLSTAGIASGSHMRTRAHVPATADIAACAQAFPASVTSAR